MGTRGESNCKRERLTLEEAIPDLIIGLIGIPVAFSLQTVADTALHDLAKWGQGLLYFSFIIVFYGLYSGLLYMTFEFGERIYNGLNEKWEQYLLGRTILNAPFAALLIGAVIGIGLGFQNPLIPIPPAAAGVVTILALVCNGGILWLLSPRSNRTLFQEFPFLLPAGVAGGASVLMFFLTFFLDFLVG